MSGFRYHPDLLAAFPNIIGGVIFAANLQNATTPPDLLELYQAEQERVKADIGDTPLSELPSISAWRSAFRQFGAEPTKHRCAAEALLRRLTKKGDIPSINLLVDLGNLVSIRYKLPVAIFDTRALAGAITVKHADGSERFTEIGSDTLTHPEVGEVVFSDPTGLVIARRWCWRQSAESAATAGTTTAVVTVEAQHPNAKVDIEKAVRDLADLLVIYTDGYLNAHILDIENPSASD